MSPTVPWRTWSGRVRFAATRFEAPESETELRTALRDARRTGERVKVVGAAHSFTPIADTTGVLLSIDALRGVRAISPDRGEVTIGAGTRLHELNRLLAAEGLALANLGDIDRQSIAGAISTGTHGTGLAWTGLAGQVSGLRLVAADGEIVTCSAQENPEVFQAARLGLGALGVITEVTMRVVPAFWLRAVEQPAPLEPTLDRFLADCRSSDHVEFLWFPHTDTVLTKHNERLPHLAGGSRLPRWRQMADDEVVANGLFSLSCRLARRAPRLTPRLNGLAGRLSSRRVYTDRSYEVFASPRRVRFTEMEYAVPLEDVVTVIREVRELIDRSPWRVSFPIEVRCAPADDVWLSTAYGRETGYVAVHRYAPEDSGDYFAAVEEIMLAHGGRPHWGKLHTRDHSYLAAQYPRMSNVLRVRDELDPDRVFGNAYLRQVLGS